MASDAIQFLTIPPPRDAAERALHPALRDWFASHIGAPTAAQCYAWTAIASGQNLLLSSPTGSGKTLAAFLPILGELLASPRDGVQALYVAPLKALVRDAFITLRKTVRSMQRAGRFADTQLSIGLRTGDTSQRVRQAHRARPPAILLTTPESLAQMLAHPDTQAMLRSVRWVIVDEVHAIIADKRGADLAISLERLSIDASLQRIGLSATCAPLATVAEFLVGIGRPCSVAQVPDRTEKHFLIEPLFHEAGFTPGWLGNLIDRVDGELASVRTALVFTNTRNLAERVTWALRRRYPGRADEIAVHHSAIAAARRRAVERRLKHGKLWIVVSSTSLELGIDVGTVDTVVFVHPPGGVVRLLQRVGRSRHRPGDPRRGVLLAASPAELIEAAVTAGSGRDGLLEPVRLADAPLDVLCQQLVGMAMTGLWDVEAAYELICRASPYRALGWRDFLDCLDYLSGRRADGQRWLPARLTWEGNCFTIADARTAKLLRRNLGTILTEDSCTIALAAPTSEDADRTLSLGEVDQVYAERLQPGDRFMLEGRCLQMRKREESVVIVEETFGRPMAPRWLGTGAGMPGELARRIFLFRAQAAEVLRDGDDALRDWLQREHRLTDDAAEELLRFISQQETVSVVPTLRQLVIECVSMQSCREYFVHTPLRRSANEAIARVLLQRERDRAALAAIASDLGIYVIAQGAAALDADDWRRCLSVHAFSEDFAAQLDRSGLLEQAFERVAQTGLMILRNPAGRKRKVGGADWTQRRLYSQLREQAPGFVLLRQAEREVVTGACDVESAQAYLSMLATMPIQVRRLAMPSPFGECLLAQTRPDSVLAAVPESA